MSPYCVSLLCPILLPEHGDRPQSETSAHLSSSSLTTHTYHTSRGNSPKELGTEADRTSRVMVWYGTRSLGMRSLGNYAIAEDDMLSLYSVFVLIPFQVQWNISGTGLYGPRGKLRHKTSSTSLTRRVLPTGSSWWTVWGTRTWCSPDSARSSPTTLPHRPLPRPSPPLWSSIT